MAMKKLSFLTVLSLSLVFSANAQSNEETKVKSAIEFLDKALVDTNRKALESITAETLTYGHSSGKVENKADFINNVFTSPIHFLKIDATEFDIKFYGNTAIVRHHFYSEVINAGKPDTIKLHVLQVWIKEKKEWKLTARQAVRL